METHARSVAKAISYRVYALALTMAVAWVLTRRADLAASIGLADAVVKVGAFYLHERLWQRIGFGRQRPPEYQI